MASSALSRLQSWYAAQCDGTWEHGYGVSIGTLDNPGWSVDIDLAGTEVAELDFATVSTEISQDDWQHCCVRDRRFEGHGGPRNLDAILGVFLDWVDANKIARSSALR